MKSLASYKPSGVGGWSSKSGSNDPMFMWSSPVAGCRDVTNRSDGVATCHIEDANSRRCCSLINAGSDSWRSCGSDCAVNNGESEVNTRRTSIRKGRRSACIGMPTIGPFSKRPLIVPLRGTRNLIQRLLYLEMAASVFSTEANQSASVPINARIASTFSGMTSDSW